MKNDEPTYRSRGRHPSRNLDPTVPPPRLPPFLVDAPAQLPNESDAEYGLFVHYFRHGVNSTQARMAAECGVTQPTISRALRRHRWVERTQLALSGTEEDDTPEAAAWAERREHLREREYELHQELIGAGREALERWRMSDHTPTAGEIVRLLEFAEKLGRLAVGLPLNHTEVNEDHTSVVRLEFEQALIQAYGQPEKEANVMEVSPSEAPT